MAKPYDATTKFLLEMNPADWLAFLGLPAAPVEVIDADLATVTTDADRVLRVGGVVPELLHFEFESGKDGIRLPGRLLRYNVLLVDRYGMPVRSIVLLLRPESDSPALTGHLELKRPDGSPYLSFEYEVIRVWLLPVENLLSGGLSLLPFAPISAVRKADLPRIVRRMEARIAAEATEEQAHELWVSTYILMGTRHSPEFTKQLLQGVRQMKESSTYQAILREGEEKGREEGRAEVEEAFRSTILNLGSKRFGTATEAVKSRLNALHSQELQKVAAHLLEVESWDELLRL